MHGQTAGYLGPTQSAGATDSHSLGPGLHRAQGGLFHGPAVSDPALDLLGYLLGHQLSIKLGPLNFLNIQLDSLTHQFLKVSPGFIDSLSASSDDDAWAGGMDSYRYLFCLALYLHQRHSSRPVPGLDASPQSQVFL